MVSTPHKTRQICRTVHTVWTRFDFQGSSYSRWRTSSETLPCHTESNLRVIVASLPRAKVRDQCLISTARISDLLYVSSFVPQVVMFAGFSWRGTVPLVFCGAYGENWPYATGAEYSHLRTAFKDRIMGNLFSCRRNDTKALTSWPIMPDVYKDPDFLEGRSISYFIK